MPIPTGQQVMSSTEIHKGAKRNFVIVLVITILFALVLGLGVFVVMTMDTTDAEARSDNFIGLSFCFVTFLAPATLLFYLGRIVFGARKRFEVYTDGFILRNTKTDAILDAALWSEVSDITWGIDKRKDRFQAVFGILLGTWMLNAAEITDERDLYIQRPEQSKLTINTAYAEPNRPHLSLRRITKDIWLADTMTSLNNGQSLRFGKLELTPQGIEYGKQLVEWKSITGTQSINDAGMISISWQDPSSKRSNEIREVLGYRGAVLIDLIYEKADIGSGLSKKLGKL